MHMLHIRSQFLYHHTNMGFTHDPLLNNIFPCMTGTFTFGDGTALPGATILSGVFNQDGSNAPYLQPIVVNFNSTNKTRYAYFICVVANVEPINTVADLEI